tara:strand:+ start:1846 stop:2328 length:483 start_codon:yes stop_codon:yes gene_type:complete
MGDTAVKRDPEKWAKAKSQAKAQMGGKHSARAMQLAVKKYNKMGGTYSGKKKKTNKLSKWAKEDWGTKSGKNSTQGSEATGERYLPKAAREALSSKEYSATTAQKRKDTKSGKQFSPQPKRIAEKTAAHRTAKDGGLITKRNHRGCGAVMPDRRKKTRYS